MAILKHGSQMVGIIKTGKKTLLNLNWLHSDMRKKQVKNGKEIFNIGIMVKKKGILSAES